MVGHALACPFFHGFRRLRLSRRKTPAWHNDPMWNAIRIGALASMVVAAGGVRAADNQLTAREKAAGWQLMFDGKSFAGW